MARKYEETDTGLLIPSVDLAMVDDVFSEVTARKERERLSKRTVLKKRDGAKIPEDLRSEDDDKISSSFARVNELATELEASGDLAGNAEFLKEYDAATDRKWLWEQRSWQLAFSSGLSPEKRQKNSRQGKNSICGSQNLWRQERQRSSVALR
jgi:hypothetical protein